MLRRPLAIALVVLGLAVPGAVGADEARTTPDEGLTVVGSRHPEDPFTSDRSVAVIEGAELLERMARTVPEALWDTPGVYVQQTNPGGGAPFIRGLVGPQNLLLVDGVRLNNSLHRTGPTQYANLFDPLSLDRVEVLRGPGSVLYGSDAMGGVVSLTPLLPGDYRDRSLDGAGHLHQRFGSADLHRVLHGDAEIGGGGFGLRAGFSYRAFDNLDGGGSVGRQPWTSYEHWSGVLSAMHRFCDDGPLAGWRLQFTWLASRMIDVERGEKFALDRSAKRYDNYDDLLYARLHMQFAPIRTQADLTVSYQRFFERADGLSFEDDGKTETKRKRDEVSADTLGVDLALRTEIIEGRLNLRYGGTWYRDWVGAEQWARANGSYFQTTGVTSFPDGSTYDIYGGFLMLEGDPLHTSSGHVLRLAAGYRLHGMSGHAPGPDGLADADWSALGHVLHGSARYLYRDRAMVGLTFSQGFRAPNLFEGVMLGDSGDYFHVPNDDLGPEKSDTIELLARGRLWRLDMEVAGYVSLLHDLLKRVKTSYDGREEIDGQEVRHHINSGEGIIAGMEARVGLDIGWGLSLHGGLAYTWGEDQDADEPLSRIPPLNGNVRLRWDSAPVFEGPVRGFVETYVRGAAKQDRLSERDEGDVRIPEGGTPAWVTWNLRAGVTIREKYRLTAAFENILDEKYKYHGSGFWAAGRQIVVSFDTRW